MNRDRAKLLKQAIIDGYPPQPEPLDSALAQRLTMPSVQDYAQDRKRIQNNSWPYGSTNERHFGGVQGDPNPATALFPNFDISLEDVGMLAASVAPVSGDAIALNDSRKYGAQAERARKEGRYLDMPGLYAESIAAGLGALPFVGGIARGVTKGAKSAIKYLDDAGKPLGGADDKVAALRAEANANRFGDVDPNIDGKLTQSAKDYFGVTRDPRETGYMLLDGSRLDLSGRHYAGGYEKKGDRYVAKSGEHDYLGGDRAVDHRELYDLPGVKQGEHQWSAVEDLMTRTGAVRYIPNQGVSIIDGQKLSDKQISSIVKDFRRNGTPLSIDIDPKGGGSAPVNKTFDKPTVDSVKAFIDANSKGN